MISYKQVLKSSLLSAFTLMFLSGEIQAQESNRQAPFPAIDKQPPRIGPKRTPPRGLIRKRVNDRMRKRGIGKGLRDNSQGRQSVPKYGNNSEFMQKNPLRGRSEFQRKRLQKKKYIQNRFNDRQEFLGEKKNQRKKFKHERREDVQKLINNDMTPTDFAKARSIKKSDFLRDRKSNKEKFKEKLSEDKAEFKQERIELKDKRLRFGPPSPRKFNLAKERRSPASKRSKNQSIEGGLDSAKTYAPDIDIDVVPELNRNENSDLSESKARNNQNILKSGNQGVRYRKDCNYLIFS